MGYSRKHKTKDTSSRSVYCVIPCAGVCLLLTVVFLSWRFLKDSAEVDVVSDGQVPTEKPLEGLLVQGDNREQPPNEENPGDSPYRTLYGASSETKIEQLQKLVEIIQRLQKDIREYLCAKEVVDSRRRMAEISMHMENALLKMRLAGRVPECVKAEKFLIDFFLKFADDILDVRENYNAAYQALEVGRGALSPSELQKAEEAVCRVDDAVGEKVDDYTKAFDMIIEAIKKKITLIRQECK